MLRVGIRACSSRPSTRAMVYLASAACRVSFSSSFSCAHSEMRIEGSAYIFASYYLPGLTCFKGYDKDHSACMLQRKPLEPHTKSSRL